MCVPVASSSFVAMSSTVSLSLSELLLPKHLTELQSFDETMLTNLFETRGMKDEL
jgi:hypothetical protein